MYPLKVTKYAVAILSLASFLPISAQHTKILSDIKKDETGVVYRLPVTNLLITVTAEKRVTVPGPFYQYAQKYAGSESPVTAELTSWRVQDVKVASYGTASDRESYLMQLKPKSLAYVGVAEDGMLLSINTPPTEPYAPSEIPARQTVSATGVVEQHPIDDYLQYVSEDFLTSVSKAKQAELLGETLNEARAAYRELSLGTSDNQPSTPEELDIMLAALERQITAILEAFNGYSYTETVAHSYTVTPGAEGKKVLCRLSDYTGFTDADDYSGAPIYITVNVTKRASTPRNAEGMPHELPKDAVIYRIPGEARVSITFEGEELYSAIIPMAQYGVNFGLDPKLFTNKKSPSHATFSPVTGALIDVADGLDPKPSQP